VRGTIHPTAQFAFDGPAGGNVEPSITKGGRRVATGEGLDGFVHTNLGEAAIATTACGSPLRVVMRQPTVRHGRAATRGWLSPILQGRKLPVLRY
jgi:hypothetical protein